MTIWVGECLKRFLNINSRNDHQTSSKERKSGKSEKNVTSATGQRASNQGDKKAGAQTSANKSGKEESKTDQVCMSVIHCHVC